MRGWMVLVVCAWRTASADPEQPAREHAWELTKDAEAAARVDDCTRVATLAGEVRALDAVFFATVLARDVAVARCLTLAPPVDPPATPPPPGATADDPVSACHRLRREMTTEAQTITNIQLRGRYLASMPDCVTRFVVEDEPPPPQPDEEDSATSSLCVEGQRSPRCVATFVGELGYGIGNIERLTAEAGLLVNGGGNHALGVTVGELGYKRMDAPGPWTSSDFLELRYRRWLTDDSGLELGIAGLRADGDRYGAMVVTAFEIRDWVALTASVELVPLGPDQVVGASAGFRLGAKPLTYALEGLVEVASFVSEMFGHPIP